MPGAAPTAAAWRQAPRKASSSRSPAPSCPAACKSRSRRGAGRHTGCKRAVALPALRRVPAPHISPGAAGAESAPPAPGSPTALRSPLAFPTGHHLHRGQLSEQEGEAEPAARRGRLPAAWGDGGADGVRSTPSVVFIPFGWNDLCILFCVICWRPPAAGAGGGRDWAAMLDPTLPLKERCHAPPSLSNACRPSGSACNIRPGYAALLHPTLQLLPCIPRSLTHTCRPSGSGKSTLLDVLSGRKTVGELQVGATGCTCPLLGPPQTLRAAPDHCSACLSSTKCCAPTGAPATLLHPPSLSSFTACHQAQPKRPRPISYDWHPCECRARWHLRATAPPPSSSAASPATWSRWVLRLLCLLWSAAALLCPCASRPGCLCTGCFNVQLGTLLGIQTAQACLAR